MFFINAGTETPQLSVMFGMVMEPLEGRALLKEAHHWEWTLRVYNFSLPVHSLCSLCVVGNVISQLRSSLEDCCHVFPAIRDPFSGIESLDKLFLSSADFVYFLNTAIKIKIHSPATKLNFINCLMSKTNRADQQKWKWDSLKHWN